MEKRGCRYNSCASYNSRFLTTHAHSTTPPVVCPPPPPPFVSAVGGFLRRVAESGIRTRDFGLRSALELWRLLSWDWRGGASGSSPSPAPARRYASSSSFLSPPLFSGRRAAELRRRLPWPYSSEVQLSRELACCGFFFSLYGSGMSFGNGFLGDLQSFSLCVDLCALV